MPMHDYLRETERPWPSLLVLLPLIAVYELAARGWLGASHAGPADQLVAFALLRRGFDLLGASGAMLPSLTLVSCLLGWHIAKRDGWRVRIAYLPAMIIEGMLLALPIVAVAVLTSRWVPCIALSEFVPERLAVLAVGAAIYEELLFRLIGFVALHLVLVDLAGLKGKAGDVGTVVGCAGLFAAYHYLGSESFTWPSVAFRTGAGCFLGALMLLRGFGVTAVCHAAYDLFCVAFLWRIGAV